jgi:hypothetical protein
MVLRLGYRATQQGGARKRQQGGEDGEPRQELTTTEIVD